MNAILERPAAIGRREMLLSSIAAISTDIGVVTAGKVQNSGGTYYVDLNASGTSAFIETPNFKVKANGEVTAAVVTLTALTTITKVIRIPHAEFVPYDSQTSYRFNAGRFTRRFGDVAGQSRFFAPVLLPKGVTITLVKARSYRANTSQTADLYLYKNDDSGTAFVLTGPLSHSSTGWQTVTSSALSQLVGDEHYSLEVELNDVTGTTGDTQFAWAEITYTMSDYAKSI